MYSAIRVPHALTFNLISTSKVRRKSLISEEGTRLDTKGERELTPEMTESFLIQEQHCCHSQARKAMGPGTARAFAALHPSLPHRL